MKKIDELEKEYIELEQKALDCDTKEAEQPYIERMNQIKQQINKLKFQK